MPKFNKNYLLRLKNEDGKIIQLEQPAIFYDEMLSVYGPGTITQIYDRIPEWAKDLFDLEEALEAYSNLTKVGVIEKTGKVYKSLNDAWRLVDAGIVTKKEIIKPVVTVDSKVKETFYYPTETIPTELE